MRKTKIICTMGPAVDDDGLIEKLMKSGMDCARFNFSHGTHAEQKERMDRVKRVREKLKLPIAMMLDTKGPEIRVRNFAGGSAHVVDGSEFTFDTKEELPGDNTRVALSYHELAKWVKPGALILLDDGKISMEVDRIEEEKIICKVTHGGKLSNHKSINIPGTSIPMPYISEVDKSDVLFGIEQGVDFVAASFVRNVDDVKAMRKLLNEHGGSAIKIIAKIENREGLDNFDEILPYTEGVMVARGDLGVEIPFSEIPSIQKELIQKCIHAGVFVITATQMLESMTHSPRPTRAEVSDVANAIYDGTSIIMLSGETAAGEFPVEAVRTMAEIAEKAESTIDYEKKFKQTDLMLTKSILDSTCVAACSAAQYVDAKAIVTVSKTGRTAARLSDFYPSCPIIAGIVSETGRRQMNTAFSVKPLEAKELKSVDELVDYARSIALKSKIVKRGDTIVIVTGSRKNIEHSSDTMKIMVL